MTPILTNGKLTANGIAISASHMGTWIFSNFVLWILSFLFVWPHCVIIISAASGWKKTKYDYWKVNGGKKTVVSSLQCKLCQWIRKDCDTHFLKYILCEALQIGSQVFWCAFRWKILEKELKLDSISGKGICLFDMISLTKKTPFLCTFLHSSQIT